MIVESFLIITMATFNFTVMSGCSRANLLMLYSDFSTDNIKRMDSVCFPVLERLLPRLVTFSWYERRRITSA